MSIVWYRKRRAGDVDSILKAILDALQGHAYENDKQIKVLKVRREEDPTNPRAVVNVKPWRQHPTEERK